MHAHAKQSPSPTAETSTEPPAGSGAARGSPTPRRVASSGGPVVRLPAVQPKVVVGRTGDSYEQEADRVADHVVAGRTASDISRIPAGGLSAQRKSDPSEREDAVEPEALQRAAEPADSARDEEDGGDDPREPSEGAAPSDAVTAQAKCASCDEDDARVQRVAEAGADEPAPAPAPRPASSSHRDEAAPNVQTQCDTCEQGESAPPAESEREQTTDDVVQRQSEDEEDFGTESEPETEQDEDEDEEPEGPVDEDDAAPDCESSEEGAGGETAGAGTVTAGSEEEEDEEEPEEGEEPGSSQEDASSGGCGEDEDADDAPEASGASQESCGASEPDEAEGGGTDESAEGAAEPTAEPAGEAQGGGGQVDANVPPCGAEVDASREADDGDGSESAGAEGSGGAPEGECATAQAKAEESTEAGGESCATCQREPEQPAGTNESAAREDTDGSARTHGANEPADEPRRPVVKPGPRENQKSEAATLLRARGPGEKLPLAVRGKLEAGLGVDLERVRVHTDGNARAASKALRAKAFTHKNHIFLGPGQSQHDIALMAHESTHVLQQGAVERKPPPVAPSPEQPARSAPEMKPQDERASTPSADASELEQAPATEADKKPNVPADGEPGPVDPSSTSDAVDASAKAPSPTADGAAALTPGEAPAGGEAAPSLDEMPAAPKPAESVGLEDDARFQGVVDRLGKAATYEKAHDPPKHKLGQAEAAVRPPPNEAESRAQSAQVDKMSAGAETGPPPAPVSFRQVLEQRLEAIKPKNMEQTLEFKSSGKAAELKGEVKGAVTKQKSAATKPLAQAAAAQLKPAGFKGPETKALGPESRDKAQRSLQAEDVLPEPKTEAEVSLQGSKDEAERMLAENDLDEEQLRRAKDPTCDQVLEAKQDLAAQADAAPAIYRERELAVLGTESKAIAKQGAHALSAMRGKRKHAKRGVRGAQEERQRLEELERQKIANDIRGKYLLAKSDVELRLQKLDGDVVLMFDKAEAAARKVFEDHVDQRMRAYKSKRYSGVRGKARWVWDKITSLPSEVNVFYVEGTELYLNAMSASFDELAAKVDSELATAKDDIDRCKADIASYIDGLEGKKKTYGKDALASISGDFDALEASIEDKKHDLADDLAARYRESREKLDQRIEELKAKNRGLAERFKAAVKRAIEIFRKLKELASILGRVVKGAIGGIIKDPGSFLNNLLGALGGGFDLFRSRIDVHLTGALMSFVTGSVREIGVSASGDGSPKGVFGTVLAVLGVTAERMKQKVVRLVGRRQVERVEQVWSRVTSLLSNGASGLWEKAKEHLVGLKEKVENEIKSWLVTRVVEAGLKFILKLFVPFGGLVKLIKTLFDIVMFFLNNIERIVDLVNGVLNAVGDVVQGKVGAAAKRIEAALGKGLALLLGFLAKLLHVSGIGDKIRSIIERVRKPVDQAIDAVLRTLVRGFKWAAAKVVSAARTTGRAARSAAKAVRRFLFPKRRFSAGKESHQLFFQGADENARLMIASDTKDLEAFVQELGNRPENRAGAQRAALDEVGKLVKQIATAKKSIAKQPDAAKKTIEPALAAIAGHLKQVLTTSDYGTQESPLPLEYPKRASHLYPKLYVGPIVGDGPRIRQEDLAVARNSIERKNAIATALPQTAQEEWQKHGMPIQEFDPHGSNQKLPLGEEIGIASKYQIAPGKKLKLPNTPRRTPGGGKINAALAPYGYSAKLQYRDGDHVIEIQLGGEDELANLWPLDASENRGAGSILSTMQFDVPGNKKQGKLDKPTMGELKARAQKGSDVWLVITKTKPV